MKKIINHVLSIVLIISLIIFMITFSIGLPIYFRPFYYLHINDLSYVQSGRWSFDTVKVAYDEVLDFLVLNKPFGTGSLKYSLEGKSHFEDCKVLFDLNFWCLIISSIIILTIFILNKFKVIEIKKYFRFDPIFYSSILAILLPIIVGIFVIIDFDRTFEIFHMIFFPGKSNWLFNPYKDQIILVLPEYFFMNCAILIGCSLLILTSSSIIASILIRNKKKTSQKSA